MQSLWVGLEIGLVLTTKMEEDSPSPLSSFCSEPLLKSDPSLDEGRTLEWNLVGWNLELFSDFLADFSAAILASLLARSAFMSASDEEMSSLVRQFFFSQAFCRLSLAGESSASHSLMILLTISDSLSLGNWALYLLYFCLENSLQTLPMSQFLPSLAILRINYNQRTVVRFEIIRILIQILYFPPNPLSHSFSIIPHFSIALLQKSRVKGQINQQIRVSIKHVLAMTQQQNWKISSFCPINPARFYSPWIMTLLVYGFFRQKFNKNC